MTVHPCRRRTVLAALPAWALGAVVPAWAQQPAAARPIRLALIEAFSGTFANTGEAVWRNVLMAAERVNARGGVPLSGGARPLEVVRYDSAGDAGQALALLRAAIDGGARSVMQGNSSAIASALVQAIERHNSRQPQQAAIFLNYAANDPALTNEHCSFWHFRFDAHIDMRLAALMDVLAADAAVKSIYLIGQDYSFGRLVLDHAAEQIAQRRADVRIAGRELHPIGRVKDFLPYMARIKATGADAVLTGNWGADLTLLIRAARDAGFGGSFYTFYANALGAPAAIGAAGEGRVYAVADWMPNVPTPESAALYEEFRRRWPREADDYVHLRMQLMVEAVAQAIERAGTADEAVAIARALEGADVTLAGRRGTMRAADHQFQQPLVVGQMQRQGSQDVPFGVEGSGWGFRIVRDISAEAATQPHTCQMKKPT